MVSTNTARSAIAGEGDGYRQLRQIGLESKVAWALLSMRWSLDRARKSPRDYSVNTFAKSGATEASQTANSDDPGGTTSSRNKRSSARQAANTTWQIS